MTKKLSLAALALISACYFTACDDDSSPSSAKSEPASSASVEAADDAESSAEAAENEAKDDEKAPESAKEDAKPASSASADKEEAKSSASIKDALSSAKENLGEAAGNIEDILEEIVNGTKVECTGEESDNEWTMNMDMTMEGIKMSTATKSVFEGTTMTATTTATTAMGDKLSCEAALIAAKAKYAQKYDNVEASCDKDGNMNIKYTESMKDVDADKKAELYKTFKSACEADMSDISISDLM